jgi:Flp pilus assembly protein TadB
MWFVRCGVRVRADGASVERTRRNRAPRRGGEVDVPTWLILILVGVVLVVLGVATDIGQFLIWIGVIVLVVSLILGLVGRTRT